MARATEAQRFEEAIKKVSDEKSFIQHLLIDALEWPIDPDVHDVESMTYDWTKEELRAKGLDKKVVDGKVRQIALENCPWGIFIVEFKNPDAFKSGRGMTGALREVLTGLVPKQRKAAHLPSFFREHLLFICTHDYRYFRFVHFKDPGAAYKAPLLASFGWWPGDSTKTVSTYNLPHLKFLDEKSTVDDWLDEWTKAFDVERVTKKFYEDYKQIHALFRDELRGVKDESDRTWLASVLLNRLMFVYFLQRKGFLDKGDEQYLEHKLEASKGKDRFYTDFLTLLFFEGFAKPWEKRSDAARQSLGEIRYLNGGLFLQHPIERKAAEAGKNITLPDSVFHALFQLFSSFSWNLNDKPGGQDNEINPDVLGYILEKYVNQKAFGAYYTRPEITGYLCERTIHRLILDAVNTPAALLSPSPGNPGEGRGEALAKRAGLPIRDYKTVADLLRKLDVPLATKLLDEVLPSLSLLDPACGSGAFLVAAMKTLIDIYAAVYGWIEFNGSPDLKARLTADRARHKSLDYYIKKRIITDNLYGVDIMEEAVEIARLRLFLALAASANTVEELEPLPNIDFNILRGNSLIGLMHVDAQRIEAKGRTGHLGGLLFQQKTYADVLAERNRQLEMYRHFSAYAEDLAGLRDKIAATNDEAQRTLDELLLADFDTLCIKFEQATWDDKKRSEGTSKKRPIEFDDIRALHPLHWAFSFDKIMARGGFDAIITNPPWEILKPNAKEFFEQHSELVTKKNMAIHDFQKEQKRLLKDGEIRESWLSYLSAFPHQSAFFRSAPDYSDQVGVVNGKRVGSDLNLYKLFTERCYRLLRDGGQCGIVVPSGIYTDLGAKGLRSMLFDRGRVRYLRSFSNEKFIFEAVHHAFKFCLLVFARGGTTRDFEGSFRINPREAVSPAELGEFLDDPAWCLHIDWALAKSLAPDSLAVVEFQSPLDITIAKKVARFPLIGDASAKPWVLELVREFDMTNDADIYHTVGSEGYLPLVEGKSIWQFDSAYAPTRYWVRPSDGRSRLLGRLADEGQTLDYQRYRVVHRRIAAKTNERSLISAVIPPDRFCADTAQPIKGGVPADRMLFINALFNSFVLDFQIRQRTTNHLDMHFMHTLPMPRMTSHDAAFRQIVDRSAKLTIGTAEFDQFAKLAGVQPADHRSGVVNSAVRAKLRTELDAMTAHLYRLDEREFVRILSTFPLVPEATRQAALDEFIRMRDNGEAAIFNPDLAKPAAAATAAVDPAMAVREMIKAGESATLEFKSTARWNVKAGMADKKMEQVIAKTAAAFLNSQGGTLIIGVEDNGNVYGLAEDYKLCGNKGRDGFENWLMQMLMKDFGRDSAAQLSVAFYELGTPNPDTPGSADVCVVTAKPSPKPRFVVEDSREVFYIRTGNATNALKMSEFLSYCAQRWPNGIEEPEPAQVAAEV